MTALTVAARAIEWERCRSCRDEGIDRRAALVLWGKLFPPDALGPKCMDCAHQWMHTDDHTISQTAALDLRPLRAALHAADTRGTR